ncbi:MAG: N-acetyltransferase [Acidimicrobiia bacterium]
MTALGVEPPPPLHGDWFRLEPLGPEHNQRDHDAWMSSIDHIRATPGFAPGDWDSDGWPAPMTLADNLGDLVMHRREFDQRIAFAYSVLSGDDVIGCLYIDPDETGAADAMVRCWVTAAWADHDQQFAEAIAEWIEREWSLGTVRFAGRG